MTLTDSMHPSDETLLAMLHQQYAAIIGTREHLAACDQCAARSRQLAGEDQAVAGLLSLLDHPAPEAHFAAALSAGRRRRQFRRAVAIAATAATLAVAAAAMVIPGAPLNRWFRPVARPPAGTRQAVAPVSPAAAPVAELASGIAIPATRSLVVHFRRDPPSGVVEISRSEASDVSFRSRGGVTAYGVASGLVSIDNQAPADVYYIDLAPGVRQVRILAGTRVILRWPEDSAAVTLPGAPMRARVVLGRAAGGVP